MNANPLKTLEQVELVHVAIRQFSGQKTLDDSEMAMDDENVVIKGSKWVIDKAKLRNFGRIRAEVARVGLQYGTRFMDGYAVPKAHMKETLSHFDRLQAEWDDMVEEFLLQYPSYVDEWANEKPKWAVSIRRSAPSVEHLRRTFTFGYQAFKINPTTEPGSGSLIFSSLDSMGMQVSKEVAQDLKTNFGGSQSQYTQRVRTTLERCKAKFDAFAFLDPMLAAAATRIQGALDTMPKEGAIKGNDFLVLAGLVSLLSQPEKVMSGQLTMVIPSSADASESLFPEDEAADEDPGLQASIVMTPAIPASQLPSADPRVPDMNW